MAERRLRETEMIRTVPVRVGVPLEQTNERLHLLHHLSSFFLASDTTSHSTPATHSRPTTAQNTVTTPLA